MCELRTRGRQARKEKAQVSKSIIRWNTTTITRQATSEVGVSVPCWGRARRELTFSVATLHQYLGYMRYTNKGVSGTCYALNGDSLSSFDVIACDPTAIVSRCCPSAVFCVDNALCLNAGSDNLWSIQGCTGSCWNAPCHRYSNSSFINKPLSYSYLRTYLWRISKCCWRHDGCLPCARQERRFLLPRSQCYLQNPKFQRAPYGPGHISSAGSGTCSGQSDRMNLGVALRYGFHDSRCRYMARMGDSESAKEDGRCEPYPFAGDGAEPKVLRLFATTST